MGSSLRRQLREVLPDSIKGLQRAIALEIADDARYDDEWRYAPERGRCSKVRLSDLVRWTGAKDELSIREMLRRMAVAGWEFRVPIGKGKDGRLLYAVPGKAMQFRVPDFEGPTTVGPSGEGPTTVAQGPTTVEEGPTTVGEGPTVVAEGPTTVGPPSPKPPYASPKDSPSSSPAGPVDAEPPAEPEATEGGGGGSDLRSIAKHIADSLDYQGQVPDKQQQEQVTAALLGALRAGWSMQGLAYYLHLGSYRPGNPVAFYLAKLTKKLPDTVPDTPEPAAAAGGVRGPVLSGAEVESLDVEAAFYGSQPAAVAPPETWAEASARVSQRMAATAPGEGTDDRVAGWRAIRDKLAAEGTRKGSHRPYTDDDWRRPATPEECVGIPWCQDVECAEIGRMREYVDDNGIKHDTPCENCHPKMLGIWSQAG